MFELESNTLFERRLERFRRRHPELQRRLSRLFRDLEENPFQARLRLHGLSGHLEGVSAAWLTYQYRVTFTIDVGTSLIKLLNIGNHGEVYR